MRVEFKGLNLGDDSGCYYVTNIDGWDDLPDVTNGSVARPRRQGSARGGLVAEKRVITADIDIAGGAGDNWLTAGPRRRLRAVTGLDDNESPLIIDIGDGPELVFARVTARSIPTSQGYERLAHASVEWTASDPRRYSEDKFMVTTGLNTPMPGAIYPLIYPFQYSSIPPLSNGSVMVRNDGNADCPMEFEITGPITNPAVTVASTNITRRTYFQLSLAAGERLKVVATTGEVTINGVDRYGTARGALVEELNLPPGVSTISFGGDGTSDARLTARWRFANI